MSRNEIISKIEQLKEWEAILEEAQAEAEALRDSIKAHMLEENTEELSVGTYIIRWTSVLSTRFDSTAQVGEFKMRMGIDEAGTEDSRMELNARHGVQPFAILLDSDDFVASTRHSNCYERSGLKPLWSQQIVRGYLSLQGTHRQKF